MVTKLWKIWLVLGLLLALGAPKISFAVEEDDEDTVSGASVASGDEDDEEEDDEEPQSGRTVAMAEGRSAIVTQGRASDDEENDAPSQTIGGWLELRPSWSGSQNSFHAENEVALEYRFSPTRAVGYTQEFRFNVLKTTPKPPETQAAKPKPEEEEEEDPDDPDDPEDPEDPDEPDARARRSAVSLVSTSQSNVVEFQMGHGYLWGEFGNLLADRATGFSLSWEPRLYLPTHAEERQYGFVAATRQYLKVEFELSPQVGLFLWEVPIFYSYRQSGYVTDDEPTANPSFENRMEFGPRLSFFNDKLRFKLPVVLQSIRTRNFDGAAPNNNRWVHYLWINPEAVVQVSETTTIGLSYYSDSLMDDRLKVADVSNGIRKGILQAVFQQAF